MRRIWVLTCSVVLTGCVSLGSDPQIYDCPVISKYETPYLTAPVIADIQRDGYADLEPDIGFRILSGDQENQTLREDPLFKALGGDSDPFSPLAANDPAPRKVLLLSGGGQWGAYGAGFLAAKYGRGKSDYAAISGVSTGALQALLIGVGGYGLLNDEYAGITQKGLIRTGGLLTALTKGYLHNTDPLRKRIETLLCETNECHGLEKLANAKSDVFVGSVELATGKFKSLHISAMARAAFPKGGGLAMSKGAAQQCVVAAVMGSIAMPAFLRPARIDGKVYVDGGVRLSVFEAVVADYAQRISAQKRYDVQLDVVRNGPTVLQPDIKQGSDGKYQADARPDVGKAAMRAYSTIVNQSELMSLAALRLSRPTGLIRYTTADGYKATCEPKRTQVKGKPSTAMFDPPFMQCLIGWGHTRAEAGWRLMPETNQTVGTGTKTGTKDI